MDALNKILIEFSSVLRELAFGIESRESFQVLLKRFGYEVTIEETVWSEMEVLSDLNQILKDTYELARTLELKQLSDINQSSLSVLGNIIENIKEGFSLLLSLEEGLDIEDFPFNQSGFWALLTKGILIEMLSITLERHYPILYSYLLFIGVIDIERVDVAGDLQTNYTKTIINWHRLYQPHSFLQEAYNWGEHISNDFPFQWKKLFENLRRIMRSLRQDDRFLLPLELPEEIGLNRDYSKEFEIYGLQIPSLHYESEEDEVFYNLGVGIFPVNSKGLFAAPDGLVLIPILQGQLGEAIDITQEISLTLNSQLDISGLLSMIVVPDQIEFKTGVKEGIKPDLHATVEGIPFIPWTLFGSYGTHRLELNGFQVTASFEGSLEDPEVKIIFNTTSSSPEQRGIQAKIDFAHSDSFIKDNVQSEKVEAGFDLEIEWSSKTGLRFGGGVDFEILLFLNQKLGPITISNFYLNLEERSQIGSHNSLRFNTGIGFSGELGPIRFFIENTGFALDIVPYDFEDLIPGEDVPMLGLVDLDLIFSPPAGLGFLIQAPAVQGGGYLEFHPDRGRYLGEAELSIIDKFTIKLIGIIDTQLPDDPDGYSFLLLVTAEFEPVQLGFGFTLDKVGGLIGIHRRIDTKAIQAAVKKDTFKQVLFPAEPLENLQSIVSSLDQLFPITKNQHSFGIMGELTWGSSRLINIKLGLLFQAPAFQIALIGTARSEIVRTLFAEEEGEEPTQKVLFRIQINFAATYDPAKSLFSFDASLYESEILGLPLSGDAAIRLRTGDSPYFMLSLGGFHPSFDPPKGLGLPALKRIALPVDSDLPGLDISAEFYCALTSNTVQFGAKGEVIYSGYGLGVKGGLEFDALFQFRPIYFIVEARGWVEVTVFGRSGGFEIKGKIEGPYPFRFALYVTFTVWKWSYDVPIPPFTIGSEAEKEKPTVDVLEELRQELEDDRNWKPVLPGRTNLLVALRDRHSTPVVGEAEAEKDLIFHPVGGIRIDQDRAPLVVILDKFGHAVPSDYNQFFLELFDEDEQEIRTRMTRQFFAPAQYFAMSKEEKLNRSSYEKLPSGLQLEVLDEVKTGKVLQKAVIYEMPPLTSTNEEEHPKKQREQSPAMDQPSFNRWVRNSSTARSALGKRYSGRRPAAEIFTLEEEEYVITSREPYPGFSDITTGSESEARQKLEELIRDRPEWEDLLVIVPKFETVPL